MREKTTTTQDGYSPTNRGKWPNFIPLFVFLVVVAEITLLGRLDMAENAAMVNSWARTFYTSPVSSISAEKDVEIPDESWVGDGNCEEWLEREDAVTYSRDFDKDPIWISGAEQEWKSCSVGCKFGFNRGSHQKLDAAFGIAQDPEVAGILRSMESSRYYPENNLGQARRWIWFSIGIWEWFF